MSKGLPYREEKYKPRMRLVAAGLNDFRKPCFSPRLGSAVPPAAPDQTAADPRAAPEVLLPCESKPLRSANGRARPVPRVLRRPSARRLPQSLRSEVMRFNEMIAQQDCFQKASAPTPATASSFPCSVDLCGAARRFSRGEPQHFSRGGRALHLLRQLAVTLAAVFRAK